MQTLAQKKEEMRMFCSVFTSTSAANSIHKQRNTKDRKPKRGERRGGSGAVGDRQGTGHRGRRLGHRGSSTERGGRKRDGADGDGVIEEGDKLFEC